VSGWIGLDMFRHDRFTDHLQPPDVGCMFGNAAMLMTQVIDKDGDRRIKFSDDAVQQFALATLVGIDGKIDADRLELCRARLPAIIQKIGQYHDIGDFAEQVDGIHRACNRALAVHFVVEKFLQHRPDLFRQYLGAVMLVAQGVSEITAIFQIEMDMLVAVQPLLERHHHMQQDFVAVADQKRLFIHDNLRGN